MSRWMPSSEGRDFELQPTLQSLEPFRERVNIVSGLKLQAAYVGESSAAGVLAKIVAFALATSTTETSAVVQSLATGVFV